MSSEIVIINRHLDLFISTFVPEAKIKDPERQKRDKKLYKTYMKKLKDMFLKNNHMVQMALK